MGEVETAHRAGRQHHETLGERNARRPLGGEKIEEDPLLGVIGQRRIPGRGPDAAILLGEHVADGEVFIPAVAPFVPRDLVQPLGEGLSEAVGKDFGHDRAIVVVVGLAATDQFLSAKAAGHGETAHVVLATALDRRDEVGVAVVMPARLAQPLLPQVVQPGLFRAPGTIDDGRGSRASSS